MTHSRLVDEYLRQGVEAEGHIDRMVRHFDAAILGCNQKDVVMTVKSLNMLEQTVELQLFPELARSFLAVFRYCGELTRKRRFDDVCRYLRPLRAAWHRAGEAAGAAAASARRDGDAEAVALIGQDHTTGNDLLDLHAR
jgi:hypothetical protein